MSLARAWIAAALNADLTQNELKAFLVIFQQTLGYGKASDALTFKRIASLARVRIDRLTPALRAIADKGLIEVQPHPIYGQSFSIPAPLLAQFSHRVFTPALPQNRKPVPLKRPPSPENQGHTVNNPTVNNPTTLNVESLPYPASFDAASRRRASEILDGLSPHDANDCLQILQQALQQGKVKSPLGLLYQLAKAARHGTLDRSGLKPKTCTHATHPYAAQTRGRLQNIQAEIQHIQGLYQLAGCELPELEQRKVVRLREEWERLRQ
jgi:hypothetical protein